jgi:hypothetical protein
MSTQYKWISIGLTTDAPRTERSPPVRQLILALLDSDTFGPDGLRGAEVNVVLRGSRG